MNVEWSSDGAYWAFDDLDRWLGSLTVPAATAITSSLADGGVTRTEAGAAASPEAIASWTERAATDLGLPASTPLGFDIRLNGVMGRANARLTARWLQPGRTIPARNVEQNGVWLTYNGCEWRIPSPSFDALTLIEQFNSTSHQSLDEQFRRWAAIQDVLGVESTQHLTDGFLRAFRVVHASAVTFNITTDSRGDVQISPVLLTTRRTSDGDDMEFVHALTEEGDALFPKRLDALALGASAFPIGHGTYVVADQELQQALRVIRSLRKAPAEQRKRAAKFPEAVIREELGLSDEAPTVFVETESFADRVRDIGDWVSPAIPWVKIQSQNWGVPTTCGVRIDGVDIPVEVGELGHVITDMKQSIQAGKGTITIGQQQLPCTAVNLQALEHLQNAVASGASGGPAAEQESSASTQVLIIETNLESSAYNRVTVGIRRGTLGLPASLKTEPKKHQRVGIEWLQRHWIAGSRGTILADDMGLGKTYQALAFCRWLRDLIESGQLPREPLLIVAPVGLLKNWEAEIETHLISPGLGSVVRAYGKHLRDLRRGQHLDGTAGLDTTALARGDVVLTNYESISNYQLSFGALPFTAMILDEAQKIKSPKARVTHAVKGLNVGFTLAMTGTPIENRLSDLWCIADAVQPGVLGDLKAFSRRYEVDDADVETLRQLIWQEEQTESTGELKILLRRLKTDKLEGLPRKYEHVTNIEMPQRQSEAYQRAIGIKEVKGPEGTLGMIHSLRQISLHPALFDHTTRMDTLHPDESARMLATFNILDEIYKSKEKALIFLESLDLQEIDQLPLLIKIRYKLQKVPSVINGNIPTHTRQLRVDIFQKSDGFNVMLLSPKAGGVGLTLTAANHVIHLSRWWNPAVEDQCSDRVYRIGQMKPVHIYYPLAIFPEAPSSSFDLQLQALMTRKRQLAQNLLSAPAFSNEDYQSLISGVLQTSTSAH